MLYSSRKERVARSQARVRALEVAQLDPNMSPNQREVIKHLARSQRAATKLHQKAQSWEEQQAKEAGVPLESQGLGPKPTTDLSAMADQGSTETEAEPD